MSHHTNKVWGRWRMGPLSAELIAHPFKSPFTRHDSDIMHAVFFIGILYKIQMWYGMAVESAQGAIGPANEVRSARPIYLMIPTLNRGK